MNWIKENKFLAALGGGTIVVVVLLLVLGLNGAGKYEAAKTGFDSAAEESSTYKRLPLYPRPENKDAKSKALDEYRKATESLQKAFEVYRPAELKNVSPEEFTNQLKAANDEVRKAFEEAGTEVPDAFFCGFEDYKTKLVPGQATGILDYELGGVKNLMLALAASGATELKNLHRPSLPEEQGTEFKPAPNQVARQLPLEISFKGPEAAVRAFFSSVVKPDGYYYVIRSLRLNNDKDTPPRASDAVFENQAATEDEAAADSFGGFVLPGGDEPAAEEGAPAGGAGPADSSRILSQVLGNEEVRVFLRLDIMQFLPAQKLP